MNEELIDNKLQSETQQVIIEGKKDVSQVSRDLISVLQNKFEANKPYSYVVVGGLLYLIFKQMK